VGGNKLGEGKAAMSHDVFISYDSTDIAAMELVCEALEARGTSCWIAPRDVRTGASFSEQIVTAVKDCRVLVLVLSRSSNINRYVENELNVAVKSGIPVAPMLIEAIELSPNLEFYIGTCQWVDATVGGAKGSLPRLLETVSRLQSAKREATGNDRSRQRFVRPNHTALLGGGLAVAAAIAVIIFLALGENGSERAGLVSAGPTGDAGHLGQPNTEQISENDAVEEVHADSLKSDTRASGQSLSEAGGVDALSSREVGPPGPDDEDHPGVASSSPPRVKSRKGPSSLEDHSVLLVPRGSYPVGCQNGDRACYDDESPRLAKVEDFWIDRTEVKREAYAKCVEEDRCPQPGTGKGCVWGDTRRGNLPINCVDWSAAAAYCAFLGMRLPSEDEWEIAARGMAHPDYPWGDHNPSCQKAAIGSFGGEDCGLTGPVSVGSFAEDESWIGAKDLGGSLREWVSDDYDSRSQGDGKPSKVNRGGSWEMRDDEIFTAHTRGADGFLTMRSDLGFRCAVAAEPGG